MAWTIPKKTNLPYPHFGDVPAELCALCGIEAAPYEEQSGPGIKETEVYIHPPTKCYFWFLFETRLGIE